MGYDIYNIRFVLNDKADYTVYLKVLNEIKKEWRF